VLGGSSNLTLAGEAEDAAREACRSFLLLLSSPSFKLLLRDDAKAYFWKRQKEGEDEDEEDEDDEDDDDEQNSEDYIDLKDVSPCLNTGDVSSLCRCLPHVERCDAAFCGTYSHLIHSSCMPKRWMVSAFQALYAPIHTALNIPLPTSPNQVLPHEDGLGEDSTPLDNLVSSKAQDDENDYSDQPEGDDDAFNLICRVANALSRGASGIDPSVDLTALDDHFQNFSLDDPEGSGTGGLIKLKESKFLVEKEQQSLQINRAVDVSDLAREFPAGLLVVSEGTFPLSIPQQAITNPEKELPVWDCSSPDFLEAFELVTAPLAHELTGVNFVWKELPALDSSFTLRQQRFRMNVSLTCAMQDAICDRSMHNSMHMVDSYESDDSESCGAASGDADEDSLAAVEEKQIRKVSRQLRARLLSLCGSIAYLLGDSMGGYE
jgi:hypothetical protein